LDKIITKGKEKTFTKSFMIVEIPDQLINQSGLSAKEILLKVALVLFQEEKLTLGQASKLAELHQYEFQKELAARNIPVHYGEEDYQRDLQTIELIK
jgi:predicted HTH domain antitoxin